MKRSPSAVPMIAIAAGTVAGAAMSWIGLAHNAQRELLIGDTERIDWGYLLAIFGAWFLAVAIPTALLLLAVPAIRRWLREHLR